MKIIGAQKLRVVSTKKVWEGGEGDCVLDTFAEIKTDVSVFDQIEETRGSRRVRPGKLYNALSEQFPERTGKHPFEVVSVAGDSSMTVKFRSGYSARPFEEDVEADEDENAEDEIV